MYIGWEAGSSSGAGGRRAAAAAGCCTLAHQQMHWCRRLRTLEAVLAWYHGDCTGSYSRHMTRPALAATYGDAASATTQAPAAPHVWLSGSRPAGCSKWLGAPKAPLAQHPGLFKLNQRQQLCKLSPSVASLVEGRDRGRSVAKCRAPGGLRHERTPPFQRRLVWHDPPMLSANKASRSRPMVSPDRYDYVGYSSRHVPPFCQQESAVGDFVGLNT